MNKLYFNKAPLSVEEQIELLKKRKLTITNESFDKHKLSIISYYRLSAYFRTFYLQCQEIFREKTSFEYLK